MSDILHVAVVIPIPIKFESFTIDRYIFRAVIMNSTKSSRKCKTRK